MTNCYELKPINEHFHEEKMAENLFGEHFHDELLHIWTWMDVIITPSCQRESKARCLVHSIHDWLPRLTHWPRFQANESRFIEEMTVFMTKSLWLIDSWLFSWCFEANYDVNGEVFMKQISLRTMFGGNVREWTSESPQSLSEKLKDWRLDVSSLWKAEVSAWSLSEKLLSSEKCHELTFGRKDWPRFQSLSSEKQGFSLKSVMNWHLWTSE